MFKQEHMTLNTCIECGRKIRMREKINLIYRDDCKKYWVHARKCYSKYSRLLLSSKEAERGAIVGFCGACAKPVRQHDKFEVRRIEYLLLSKLIPLRSFPKKDDIYFFHKRCIVKG